MEAARQIVKADALSNAIQKKIEAFTKEIQSAKTFEQYRKLLLKAEALRKMLRGVRSPALIRGDVALGRSCLVSMNDVAEQKLRIERRIGKELPGATRPQGRNKLASCNTTLHEPTLDELGIARMQSTRWKLEATVLEPDFLDFLKECREAEREITSAGLLEIAKGMKSAKEKKDRASKNESIDGKVRSLEEAAGLWRCIYADPPWSYNDAGCDGAAEHEYATMPIDAIKALPVGNLAHEDGAHLWLWTTWPMIREGAPHAVLAAWGFRWVGEVVWIKPGLGVGRWLRPSTEVLVLGVRGDLKLLRNNQRGDLPAPRERHSEKPEQFRELVESLSPGPRIELFARTAKNGWSRWGDES